MATQSFFGQYYLDLAAHIATQVPEIKWIDQDFGQLEIFDTRPSVNWPCCLIDFPVANYENISELGQLAMVSVQLRLGFAPFSQSHQRAPDSVKEKALEYYAIEQKLFEAVHGWTTLYAQPLIRTSVGSEQRMSAGDKADASGLRVRVMNFSTSFEDNSNFRQYAKEPVTLEVETDIVLE